MPPRALTAEVNGVNPVQGRTVECARLVAQWHLLHGAPIIASCALLAVDDVKVLHPMCAIILNIFHRLIFTALLYSVLNGNYCLYLFNEMIKVKYLKVMKLNFT